MSNPEAYEPIGSEMSPDERTATANDALAGFITFERDRKTFNRLIRVVPEEHQQPYFDRLREHLANKNVAEGRSSFYGMMHELGMIQEVLDQGLETINFDVCQHIGAVAYNGYASASDLETTPVKPLRSGIEVDVPIERDGKPYVFEAKSSFREGFGSKSQHRNQLLKYQAAIDKDIVAGASIRLKGMLDGSFWEWANRSGEEATIPDIELLYTLDLPSNTPYTASLKETKDHEGFRYDNPIPVRREDKELVRYINRAIKRGVYGDIIVLASEDVGPQEDRGLTQDMRVARTELFKTTVYKLLADYTKGKPYVGARIRMKQLQVDDTK